MVHRLQGFRILMAAVAIWLAGCASDDVRVSRAFDPLARFPASATYVWDDAASSLPDDERLRDLDLDALLKEVGGEAFAARGYSATESWPADYRMSYQLTTFDWISAERSTSTASLSFLLRDSSNRRVWMGWGRAEIHVGLSREERKARLRDALDRMLEGFPPSQRPE